MTNRNTNPMRIPCCPVRAYASPAHEPDVVYVEEVKPATRAALVLGVRVEIPLQGPPARTFNKT